MLAFFLVEVELLLFGEDFVEVDVVVSLIEALVEELVQFKKVCLPVFGDLHVHFALGLDVGDVG